MTAGAAARYGDLIVDLTATDAERTSCAGAPASPFRQSSELSPSFPGYVEGAIVAGRIAARKIVASFKFLAEHDLWTKVPVCPRKSVPTFCALTFVRDQL